MWQSLSEVQGTGRNIRLSIGPHGACPHHTYHAERHSFVFLKFSGTTTQNLTARTTTIVRFGTSFGEDCSLAKFAWRNVLAKFAWRNLPAKFAAEICQRNSGGICRQNLRRKKIGKDKPDFRRKTTPQIFHLQTPPFSNVPLTHPKNPACFLEVGPREQLRSRDSVCSRSADSSAKQAARREVPKLGFSVIFAVT